MIGVVDYGAGNLRNVQAALVRLGARWSSVTRRADLDGLDGVILPGVGQFGAAARRLREAELFDPLREWIAADRPFLGICLGMQLLFQRSDEETNAEGLGVFDGTVRRLEADRLPHIGWAVVEPRDDMAGTMFTGLAEEPFFAYFAHSYALNPDTPTAAALTSCPPPFASAIRSGNIWGVQFHPEKSGAPGHRLLAGFVSLTTGGAGQGAAKAGTAKRGRRHGGLHMRARRVIPCLDIRGGRVVKGVKFRDLRDAGDPVERARAYDRDGADEICFLDISASHEERRPLLDLVGRVADELTVPFTVGGGIRDLGEMRALLLAGADRVSLGTAALDDPDLVRRAAETFGSQFVIVSIDALRSGDRFEVTSHGGRRRRDRDAVEWAREVERLGAGEILLNAMDADGTRAGYDIPLTRAVSRAVRVPVIASGGAGTAVDMARALIEGGADAALAASMFHDGSVSIREAKRVLSAEGVAVRP